MLLTVHTKIKHAAFDKINCTVEIMLTEENISASFFSVVFIMLSHTVLILLVSVQSHKIRLHSLNLALNSQYKGSSSNPFFSSPVVDEKGSDQVTCWLID